MYLNAFISPLNAFIFPLTASYNYLHVTQLMIGIFPQLEFPKKFLPLHSASCFSILSSASVCLHPKW